MDQRDIDRVQAHLKRTFGNPHIALKARERQKDSAEVELKGEFIGVVYEDEDEDEDDEGCLSFPSLVFPVKRAFGAVAKGFNMYGDPVTIEGTDLLARCVQHETDHLDGILFIDRMDSAQRKLAMKAIREAEWWADPPQVRVSPHETFGRAL